MKELKSRSLLIYDPETGEKTEIDIFKGESAYEAAVRLGLTTLTEDEWVKEYNANRDAAIAAIETKAAEALASIPEDYTQIQEDVNQLSEEIADLSLEIGYSEIPNILYGRVVEQQTGTTATAMTEYRLTENAMGVPLTAGKKYLVYYSFVIGEGTTGWLSETAFIPYLRDITANATKPIEVVVGERLRDKVAGDRITLYGYFSPTVDYAKVGGWCASLNGGTDERTYEWTFDKVYLIDISDFSDEDVSFIVNALDAIDGNKRAVSKASRIDIIERRLDEEDSNVNTASKKQNLFTDKTKIENSILNQVGWVETLDGYSTNRYGIEVNENTYYTLCVEDVAYPVLYVSFKTADDVTGYVQSTHLTRISNMCYVQAPEGAKYMFFSVGDEYWDSVSVYEGASPYNPISDQLWTCGKTLMTLGDSLTEQGIWQNYLLGKLGFSSLVNLAIGGTKVTAFADNVTLENIADIDLITIMGFFNSSASVAGEVNDSASNDAEASICANYKYLIDKIYTLKPSVKILLMTPHCPRADDVSEKAEAVKSIARYYKIPCIDLYNELGFNSYTYDIYLRDTVHSSYGVNGGYAKEQIAICGGIMKYFC